MGLAGRPTLCIIVLGATPASAPLAATRPARLARRRLAPRSKAVMLTDREAIAPLLFGEGSAVIGAATSMLVGILSWSPAPAPSEAPGGYWSLGEQRDRQREPKDGEEELTIGSVLLSLGLLRAGAGAVTIWMGDQPRFCDPADPTTDCGSLRTYGWVGVGEGGLMFTTGIVYLAIGAHHRRRHDAWRRGEPLALRIGHAGQRLTLRPWLHLAPGAQPGLELGASGPIHPLRADPALSLTGGGLRVHVRF